MDRIVVALNGVTGVQVQPGIDLGPTPSAERRWTDVPELSP
ncbi:hypothetical protein B0I31_11117 [Saccharothrix carnea]|uniref:Uncharacterized protein n=1 Tax=Saccharothrix carnea TaxID=1280637 RepID=A0A2P8I2N6_SACCR|nr:hypothetical protein [Saccharothrix carnea]PSL52730.1 hypothetical protein B0I31_11117 [Saccharothrix carnea]